MFVNRFSAIIELIEEVAFGRMDIRLMEYLIEKAENDRITSTHQQIANDLGTSREVVSRLLKDLERKKKVVLARNLVQLLSDCKYACACGPTCPCETISQNPGQCTCKKDMKAVN